MVRQASNNNRSHYYNNTSHVSFVQEINPPLQDVSFIVELLKKNKHYCNTLYWIIIINYTLTIINIICIINFRHHNIIIKEVLFRGSTKRKKVKYMYMAPYHAILMLF